MNMRPQWIAWVLVSTLLPAAPFFLNERRVLDNGGGIPWIIVAVVAQLVCSVLLAKGFSDQRGKGTGHVILLTFVFMIAAVAIGTASFFGACVLTSGGTNFH